MASLHILSIAGSAERSSMSDWVNPWPRSPSERDDNKILSREFCTFCAQMIRRFWEADCTNDCLPVRHSFVHGQSFVH